MKRFLPWTLIGCTVVVAGYAANWPTIRFAKLEPSNFVSRLAALLLFALLIERTVEVFLTIWRAEQSYKRQAAVQRASQFCHPRQHELNVFAMAYQYDMFFSYKRDREATQCSPEAPTPIHKLMDAFRKFMEASLARACGAMK